MILAGYNWQDIGLGILYVSLALLVLVIAYRKLLRYLGKGQPVKADYLVLYAQEDKVAKGEVVFYFTAESPKDYRLVILNQDLDEIAVVKEGTCTLGGNIVCYDSTSVADGDYFFCIITDNQRTMKKLAVRNK